MSFINTTQDISNSEITINKDISTNESNANIYYENEGDIILQKGRFLCEERYNIYMHLVKKIKENNKEGISRYVFYNNTIKNTRIYICLFLYSSIILILIKKLFYK